MSEENYTTRHKEIHFKDYKDLSKMETDFKLLKEGGYDPLEISVLGQVGNFNSNNNIVTSNVLNPIEMFWKKIIDDQILFGFFQNPEMGNVYIAGPLTPIFLNKLDGRTVGMLSAGPVGVFRGIGASEIQAEHYLALLNGGKYILILRALIDDMPKYRKILGDQKN